MEKQERKIDADKTLMLLGKWGIYQQWTFWLGHMVWLFCALQMMACAFLGSTPPFKCFSDDFNTTNSTQNACIIKEKNGSAEKHCGDSGTTVWFDHKFGDTIVSTWNLICNHAYMAEMASSAFFLGFLIGSIIAPGFADKYGRRRALIAYYFGLAFSGTILAFSPNYTIFVIIRIFAGIFTSGISITGFNLACEVVVTSLRAWGSSVLAVWWITGYCCVGLIAYMFPNWRTMSLAFGVPCWFGLSYYWLIPESLHWLVAKNRQEDAKRWILKAARWNKINIKLDDCCSETNCTFLKKTSPCDAFKSPLLLIQIAIMAYIWFSNCFVYYGLSLYSTKLAGNRYINYILSGVVEAPAYIILTWSFNRLGRKKTIIIFSALGSLSLFVLPFLPHEDHISPIITTFWLIGKFSVTITFIGAWVYGAEIFPTTVRNTGVGICNIAARSGGILAPFVRILADLNPSTNLPDNIDEIIAGPILGCLEKANSDLEISYAIDVDGDTEQPVLSKFHNS